MIIGVRCLTVFPCSQKRKEERNQTMECNNVTTIPKGLLQLRGSLSSMMDSLYYGPKVAELMNTSMGQYLNGHPFLALAVLVFGAMATVPIGIFLTFATVTFIGATVGLVLLEVFLLSLGGVSLLCVLSALAILAILVSLVLGACYITSYNVLNFYYSQRASKYRVTRLEPATNITVMEEDREEYEEAYGKPEV
uniref:Transmembrane protein 159 n=1 Tax=Hucho hucho TaxID=62062 RepID=A0A4W5RG06_9TELE